MLLDCGTGRSASYLCYPPIVERNLEITKSSFMFLENLWSEADYLLLKIRDAATTVETRSQRIRYKAYNPSNNADDGRLFGHIL
jgi:hypothetical protein